MSRYNLTTYDETYPQNLSLVLTNLKDSNIIYSKQYISNEETQFDADGLESNWSITILCIEKTEDDYIFHFNYSNDQFHSYSYPYFREVSKFSTWSKKLSDLKNETMLISEKSTSDIGKYLNPWDNDYRMIFESSDEKLKSEMNILSSKVDEIETLYIEKCDIERAQIEKERKEFLQSEEYQQILQEEKDRDAKQKEHEAKEEEDRLQLCIKLYGEVDGRKFHSRL